MTQSQSPSPEPELLRALELADGYLSDAEHVLWKAAAESDHRELSAKIEDLTQQIWAIQQDLHDIQNDFKQ